MSVINERSSKDSFFRDNLEDGFKDKLSVSARKQSKIRNFRKDAFEKSLKHYGGPIYQSIIIDLNSDCASLLKGWLDRLFPEIIIIASVKSLSEARALIINNRLDLIFSDVEVIENIVETDKGKYKSEIISISKNYEDAVRALRNNRCGFIKIPLDIKDFAISVQCALNKITKARIEKNSGTNIELPHNKLVGIPTLEGIEFINIDEIIRCEGLQKYTLIITTLKSDVISSYNLGKFKSLLEGRGFFSCHRSHFINLKFVKKYSREGYIHFNATSKPVPLARRKKNDFLAQLRHL